MITVRKLESVYKTISHEIEVIHPGGERKFLPVEIITEKWISVRWGQSGIYDVYLDTGIMQARSAAARRKAPCLWKAVDVSELRQFMREYLKLDTKEQQKKRIDQHEKSMPGAAKPSGVCFLGGVRTSRK